MPKKIYMIVTNDEYETPIKTDIIGVKKVAEFIGVSESHIRNMLCGAIPWTIRYKVIVCGDYKPNVKSYQKKYSMEHDRTEYFQEYFKKNKSKLTEKRKDYQKRYSMEHDRTEYRREYYRKNRYAME